MTENTGRQFRCARAVVGTGVLIGVIRSAYMPERFLCAKLKNAKAYLLMHQEILRLSMLQRILLLPTY